MEKVKIYIDTSVIGGCFDDEFSKWSNKLFEEFRSGNKIAVISDLVIEELKNAPIKVKNKLKEIPDEFIIIANNNAAMTQLAEEYLKQEVLSKKFKDDALHIATATILNIDVLVSWNFKHIVNFNRIKQFNGVNLLNGYNEIDIRSPQEVIDNED
ncbi:MAG: PIN domain-containing protein [Candidatus Cloacimonetes bacterium]|nr:PIN domain-containing protein [Candidatus Cloacimonadota bacterium]